MVINLDIKTKGRVKMIPGLIAGAVVERIATKAFERVGGVQGLKDTKDRLVSSTTEYAADITDAVKAGDMGRGAEVLGTIASDVTDNAKTIGVASVEIGMETVQEAQDLATNTVDTVKQAIATNKAATKANEPAAIRVQRAPSKTKKPKNPGQ